MNSSRPLRSLRPKQTAARAAADSQRPIRSGSRGDARPWRRSAARSGLDFPRMCTEELHRVDTWRILVRPGPIPLSTVHWDLFLSIEQCPSLVDRLRNDRCAFVGETAVPHAAVCRRHDSGAELPVRAGQNVVAVCLPMDAPDDRCRMNDAVGIPKTSDRRH